MRALIIGVLMVFPVIAATIDWDSYCEGWCKARYKGGFHKSDSCACYDLYPINPSNIIHKAPVRPKKDFETPAVYDGVDEPHYPKSDD